MGSAESVSTADLRCMLDLVDAGRVEPSSEVMPVAVLTGLARLIPAEWVCFSELDLVGRRAVYYADAEGGTSTDVSAEDLDGYLRTSHQHPTCRIDQQHPDRLPVLAVSDVVSLLELRRREIYGDRFAANGADDELSIPLPRPSGRTRVFILGRAGYGFTEREHLIARLLQPHLQNLYRERKQALAPSAHVTIRERDVLQCVAEGLTDADIAARLAISIGTVRKHLDNVFARLAVTTRTAAVARAIGSPSDQ